MRVYRIMWASASLTILITQGNIDVVQFHNLMVLILRAALLAFFAVWGALANTADKSTKDAAGVHYAWQQVVAELEEQRDQLSGNMKDARDVLLERAQKENPDFVARLYLKPPRRGGYQNIPAIKPNPPLASITPQTQTFSLEKLQKRFETHVRGSVELNEQVLVTPSLALEPQVIEFERLRWQLRNMESRLAYHVQWQPAAAEQVGFYAGRNRIAASIGEMQTLEENGGSADRIAELRQGVDERVATFNPSTGLAIRINGDGDRILPVTVYTDIHDEEFLEAFQEGVQEAFSSSEAARKQRFAVSLEIRQLTVAELYPQGAPARGSAINLKKHIALYPPGELILTTGGASTHALAGRNVTLGPNPTTRRTLAHEFGHLLGFSDAYLRSYQGDTQDPYGVVFLEWVGLIDNLMGNPGTGRVTYGMIETLINAYSAP
jgi:hypothetical protein